MYKLILIALILVHVTLQEEVSTFEKDGNGHVEAKKYYNKEHKFKEDKYNSHEHYKKEKHHKRDKDDNGKWVKQENDNDWKRYEKAEDHKEEKQFKHQKEHRHRREEVSISLIDDINVNRVAENKVKEGRTALANGNHIEKKNFYENMPKIDLATPPSPDNTILMARYIVHSVDWAAIATSGKRSNSKSGPFANVVSMSDGPVEQGSGIPFFYLTPMDLSSQDLQKENKASVTVTLAQTDYCRKQTLDPEDPRCARVILSGKVKRVQAGTVEETFAKKALFSRHPVMEKWPKDHEFYFAKFKISEIILLDQFGGPKYLDVAEYLNPVKNN